MAGKGGESGELLVTKIREIGVAIDAFTNVYVESASFGGGELGFHKFDASGPGAEEGSPPM